MTFEQKAREGASSLTKRRIRVARKNREPSEKISRGEMDQLREMNKIDPKTYTPRQLSKIFRIEAQAVVRILKSKFRKEGEL